MRVIDAVEDAVKGYPEGIATNELTAILFPNIPKWEFDSRRTQVYAKLRKLQQYGIVKSTLVALPSGGKGLRVWTINKEV